MTLIINWCSRALDLSKGHHHKIDEGLSSRQFELNSLPALCIAFHGLCLLSSVILEPALLTLPVIPMDLIMGIMV